MKAVVDFRTLTPAQGGTLPKAMPTHNWQPWATVEKDPRGYREPGESRSHSRRRCRVCGRVEFGIGDGFAPPGDPACFGKRA